MQLLLRNCIANKILDFTPNPSRRHTRGRRGREYMEGFLADQTDFELAQEQEDRHAAGAAGVRRDRAKRERSDEKKFKLRGFKGKGFQMFHGLQRSEAMVSAARKARVAAGSEGVSKKTRRFMVEEGLNKPGMAPHQPWSSRTKKAKKASHSEKPFILAAAVARFKRTGDLPNVDVQVLKDSDASGVDGKTLRRMIQAMLIRGGVEQDPGPIGDDGYEVCPYKGMRIQGEWFQTKPRADKPSARILVCPTCHAHLGGLWDKKTRMGDHPGDMVFPSVPDQPLPSAPSVEVLLQPAQPPQMPSLEPARLEPAVGPRPPPAAPVPPPPPPPKPAPAKDQKAKNEHILAGHEISVEDRIAIMSKLCGREVEADEIKVQEVVVPYTCDKRLAISRNVEEIQQGFIAKQMRVTVPKTNWNAYILGLLLLACVAEVGASMYFERPNLGIIGATCFVCFTGTYLIFFNRDPGERDFYCSYMPHLISCVMSEYDRGTSAYVAKSTLRQRIRRLAALPLPDRDALKFINGSELVIEQLLDGEDFFWQGASVFPTPQ